MARQLSQQEIDAVFSNLQEQQGEDQRGKRAVPFDFRRPDRIAKSQLRAIHLLHDTFVRNLVSSLSAYLRTYLIVNLISVEQLSYAEFLEGLASPTCMISLGLRPYDGNAVLELNPALIFPILEILLGGDGKSSPNIQREITEIEQNLLEGLFRIILHDLEEAWKGVTPIEFTIESLETEPQFLRILAPNEAVVAVGVEIRIGESIGMMNIAMPSIIIKMMRQKFDQQWSVRRTQSTEAEQAGILRLIRQGTVHLDARLQGPTLKVDELIGLSEGDILTFDYGVERRLDCLLNRKAKFQGEVVSTGRRRAFLIEGLPEPPQPGPTRHVLPRAQPETPEAGG